MAEREKMKARGSVISSLFNMDAVMGAVQGTLTPSSYGPQAPDHRPIDPGHMATGQKPQ